MIKKSEKISKRKEELINFGNMVPFYERLKLQTNEMENKARS